MCNKTGTIIFDRVGGEGRGEGNINNFSHKCNTLLKLFTYEKIQNLKAENKFVDKEEGSQERLGFKL